MSNEKPTPESLMIRYRNGNTGAFDQLYARYSGRVYGYLRKNIYQASDETIDEVFQSIFFKLHRSRTQYEDRYSFEPWLFTICRSVVVDYLRKSVTTPTHRANPIDSIPVQKLVTQATQDNLDTLDPKIGEALNQLPDKQKAVVSQRLLEEKDFNEIAITLKTSPANVRQILSRGVRRLRKLLEA